ncbi:DUF559 domain-containing protein [Hoeflea sp.]|uniref:DUF559 domain-containing protein n=1 Tax=Hoeflea sp. TaxID=1940281 RepID=UPI003A95989F
MLRARRLGGMKFKRPEPLGATICDFVCHAHKRVMEADGSQHAGSVRDGERDRSFETRGYRTLRFWNEDIQENIDGVAEQIIQAAAGR